MLNENQERELCYVVNIDGIEPIVGSDNCEAAHYPWVECGYEGNVGRYTHRMFNFEHKLWREMTLADYNNCDPELNGDD